MYFYQAKRIAADPSLLLNPEIAYFPPLLFIIGAFMHTILGEIGLKLIAPFSEPLVCILHIAWEKSCSAKSRALWRLFF